VAALIPPLLRAAPVAVASLDPDGRILDVNQALVDLTGCGADELVGRPLADLVEPGGPELQAVIAGVTGGRVEGHRGEYRHRRRGGELRDLELSVSSVPESGRPSGALAWILDVTAHKDAVREAARRAAELEAVIQSMPAAVLIGDATGVKVVNRRALAYLGFSSAEEMNRQPIELAESLRARDNRTGAPLTPDTLAFSRALRGEQVDREMRINHRQTGAERIHRVIAAPVALDGRTVGAVAILADVTDARATEEALRLSSASYRELFEQSPLSIQILSPEGTTLRVNRAWERLWGIRVEQIGDLNLLEDAQLVERGLMPYLQKAFDGEAVEIPVALYDPDITLPDRSTHADPRRWVRAVAYPVKGAAGEVREVVLIHEDVTEQVRAEEDRVRVAAERERLLAEAQRAHAEAEAASRVKDQFLALLSHELRTPLNAVLGWARILRTREIGDQTAHAVAVIERNAAAQARMIDDLLDVSRIVTGKIRLQTAPVSVSAVCAAALESIRPAAEARRVAIAVRAAAELPLITADAERLQQVFWNLFSNAVKFTDPGGSVTVSLDAAACSLRVEVTDTGIGIPAEILPYVFERFTQADSSNTRAYSGLGLGLAITRHIVELHGGTVSAESPGPGKGSTFRITLPR
jgi:PAS domain S-box-containing protein